MARMTSYLARRLAVILSLAVGRRAWLVIGLAWATTLTPALSLRGRGGFGAEPDVGAADVAPAEAKVVKINVAKNESWTYGNWQIAVEKVSVSKSADGSSFTISFSIRNSTERERLIDHDAIALFSGLAVTDDEETNYGPHHSGSATGTVVVPGASIEFWVQFAGLPYAKAKELYAIIPATDEHDEIRFVIPRRKIARRR